MRTFSTVKVQKCIMSRLNSASGRSISRILSSPVGGWTAISLGGLPGTHGDEQSLIPA